MPELIGQGSIIFTFQIIADIYLGHITHWNDSAIVKLNPHLKDHLPSQPLLVVYEPGTSSTAGKVTKMLSVISEFNQTVSAHHFHESVHKTYVIL